MHVFNTIGRDLSDGDFITEIFLMATKLKMFFLFLFVSSVLQTFLPDSPGKRFWVQLCPLQQRQEHSKTAQVWRLIALTDTCRWKSYTRDAAVPSIQETVIMQIITTMSNFRVLYYNQQGRSQERNWIIHITVQPKLIADLRKNESNDN